LLFSYKNADKLPFLKNLLMGDWPILCGRERAFLGPKVKPANIAACQLLMAEFLFDGPSSTICSGVKLPALIASRANPWCERVSAKPMGIAVGSSTDATST
jgi:hypothetical protein